jgi:hypothetical protein
MPMHQCRASHLTLLFGSYFWWTKYNVVRDLIACSIALPVHALLRPVSHQIIGNLMEVNIFVPFSIVRMFGQTLNLS